jgi:hypothetical protein
LTKAVVEAGADCSHEPGQRGDGKRLSRRRVRTTFTEGFDTADLKEAQRLLDELA